MGFTPSLVLGALGTALAIVISSRLPLLAGARREPASSPRPSPPSSTGLLFLTTRRKAISQVLGYLMLENGIFMFGLLLVEACPFLVEVGVLLDLFVGIFVMGIIINHINREFSSINTQHLTDAERNEGMVNCLIFIPLALAAAALAVPSNRLRPWLLPAGGRPPPGAHDRDVIRTVGPPRRPVSGGVARARRPPGRLVLVLVSVLFCVSLLLRGGLSAPPRGAVQPRLLRLPPGVSSAMTSLVAASQHLGLMWVADGGHDASATAPLIYFNHNRRSIEATWKYLLICSVGIALVAAGHVLPRLRLAAGRGSSRRSSSTTC